MNSSSERSQAPLDVRSHFLEPIAADLHHSGMARGLQGSEILKIAAEIRAMKAAGFRSVSVSVDGLEPMHDALRGVRGSWRAALSSIRALKSAGIPVSANTQITRPGLTQIEEKIGRAHV